MATSTNERLGLPYQGSKRRIAKRIVDLFPAAPALVDLFAGGCAVTHAALLSGKFDRVIANDLSDAPELFYRGAKSGGIKPVWVSREDFFAKKDADPVVRYCFSFGNDGRSYLYGREIEPLKRALHHAIVEGDCSGLPLNIRGAVAHALADIRGVSERYRVYKDTARRLSLNVDHYRPPNLERLQSLERLQRLERLQSLEHLQRLGGLTISRRDYRDVHIPDGSVIYCDPPYTSTTGYGQRFDHATFYQWCRTVGKRFPLFVSEYWMPADFKVVAEFEVAVLRDSRTNAQTRVEKIFIL